MPVVTYTIYLVTPKKKKTMTRSSDYEELYVSHFHATISVYLINRGYSPVLDQSEKKIVGCD